MDKTQKTKRKSPRIIIISAISLVLVAAIAAGIIIGVNLHTTKKKGPVIMECEGEELRLSFYEFMLSRVKGKLKNQREEVNSSAFWEKEFSDGVTNEEYYKNLVLEDCKVYLASLAMFERLKDDGEISGLPASYTSQIEEDLELYISTGYIGGGSEEKFDEILSEFGVDTDMLREIYTIEAKMSYVRDYLYGGSDGSKIGDNVKEEFYNDNYYRFKHILVGNFYCKYQKDEFGNDIYFEGEGGLALYDYNLGTKEYDEKGNFIKDKNGVPIAFGKNGEYVYDTENGIRIYEKNEDGSVKKYGYTAAEMAERRNITSTLLAIQTGDFEEFEKMGKDGSINTDYSETFAESSGIYASELEISLYTGQISYMNEILEKLSNMEIGEIAMVEADDGYHVFMKYENDEGAYSDTYNKEWFPTFMSKLINKLFLQKCHTMFGEIKIYEDKISEVLPMREIGANTYY